MATPSLPAGDLPETETLKTSIRRILDDVGVASLSMAVLRSRLQGEYKIDFKPHVDALGEFVKQIMEEPATRAALAKVQKDRAAPVAQAGKKKRARDSSPKKEKTLKTKGEKAAKKEKQEGEPKKALSAYFIFANEKRPEVMTEISQDAGGKVDVKIVAKKISEIWNAMSEADKAPYAEKAAKDKERYAQEKSAFEAAGGTMSKRSSKKDTKDKKSKKDKPAGPKRAQTAFFAFSEEVAPGIRARMKEANGKVNIADVGREVGVLWKALEDKSKYEAIAAKDKARYEAEKAALGSVPATKKRRQESSSSSDSSSSDSSSSDSSSDSDSE